MRSASGYPPMPMQPCLPLFSSRGSSVQKYTDSPFASPIEMLGPIPCAANTGHLESRLDFPA